MSLLLLSSVALAEGWPTFGHDARRTSQSGAVGAQAAEEVLATPILEGQAINMPPVVADDGTVLVGTWGMVRSQGSEDRTAWDKFDGALYAFDADLSPRWTFEPDLTPWCYDYDGRSDEQCPDGGEWNSYNGTVEGTPVIVDGAIIFGRGDGKLYAVDGAGAKLWSFSTFNPEDTADPEGGGEIVGGPVATPDGAIVFGTIAAGDYETNAVYAVDAATGALRWRYPSTDRGLDGIVLAPPALSPDGSTVYVGTAWGPTVDFDAESAGSIYAINVGSGEASWVYQPVDHSLWWEPWAWMQRLAVGSDGTLWVAASMYTVDAGQAVIFALADAGDHATALQESWTQLDATGQWALGLALDESAGETWRVVVGTSSAPVLGAYRDLGAITAIDPATRGVEWQFYPQDASLSGGVTGVSLDANGNTFATVSGNSDVGHVIMLDVEGQLVWNVGLGGLAEWGSPSIGPDGTVYVADTRQCALRGFPIEDGLCDGVNITPVVYGIRGETVPLDTGRQDEIPANPVGEEECACGTALPRGLGLMPAGWAVLRRRRG